jgi:1-acyl-sn-glycerol-3-phosphate acyltransferase
MRSSDKRPISQFALRLFTSYAHMYVRRHMHSIRVVNGSAPGPLEGWPVIVCLNHPSWWDPLIALALAKATFSGRSHYAPIDSAALSKYPIFERVGFFGIDPGTIRGAERFLQTSKTILADPKNTLWITGEGAFTDVRNRPVKLRPGIGHLVHSLDRIAVLPLALEYSFWEERSPEVLVCWGEPMLITTGSQRRPSHWTEVTAEAVERALDRLADLSKCRDKKAFDVLLSGSSGIGGIYDLLRGLRARVTGRRFTPQHGSEDF